MAADDPRERRGCKRDPILNTRAPAPLIELVRAKARARKVTVSEIIREALARHVGSEAA